MFQEMLFPRIRFGKLETKTNKKGNDPSSQMI